MPLLTDYQSGGLGVGNSKLPAPTNKIRYLHQRPEELSAPYPHASLVCMGVTWLKVARSRSFVSTLELSTRPRKGRRSRDWI